MGGTICVQNRDQNQVAKALLWLPYWIVNQMLACVKSAEEKLKGTPPSIIQIFVEMKQNYNLPVNNIYEGAAVLTSLFREDWLYTDETAVCYSLKRHEGFMLYSEMFRKRYGNEYMTGRDGTCVPTTARKINFKNLIDMLKSKDEAVFTKNKWVYDGDFKFCDGEKLGSKIAFNTYPRSGNSFLRKYLEQLTGISTGATVQLHTSSSLQIMGLKGEYICDDRTWIVKAHHPMLLPGVLQFKSDKVVCCVRNPLDVILSFASLSNTMSHAAQPPFSYDKDYPEWWNWWVTDQAKAHARYFETMLRHCNQEGRNPIYIVRYEDLVSNPRPELEGIMKYLLDLDDISGTNAQRRVDQVIDMGAASSQTYKLKSTTGKFNNAKGRYTDAQIKLIQEMNADHLYYFGYANHPTEENKTAFFEFNEHKKEHLDKYYGFRKDNQKFVDKLAKEGGWKGPQYGVNSDKECFDFYPQAEVSKVQEPSRDYARKTLGYPAPKE